MMKRNLRRRSNCLRRLPPSRVFRIGRGWWRGLGDFWENLAVSYWLLGVSLQNINRDIQDRVEVEEWRRVVGEKGGGEVAE